MKIGFITMEKHENREKDSVGSSRIRGRWMWEKWEGAEEYRVGGEYDVMIFQKSYWREMMQEFKGIKIFDLCDPDWLEPRPVVEVMDYCHAMVASTEALAEYLRHFIKDKPVVCIPDRVNLDEHKPREIHTGYAKQVCWFGYSHNTNYLIKCFDFLIANNLELTIISNTDYTVPMGYEKLKITNVKYSYDSIHDEIKKCDMVLMPTTEDNLKGRYKSNNKILTSWALGMPVARMPEDLTRFINPDERNKERDVRLMEVKSKWDVRISIEEYKKLIKSL